MFKFHLIFGVFCLNFFSIHLLYAKTQTYEFDLETKFGKIHFEVHHDAKDEILAKRVENIARNDLIKVVEYFEYAPNETLHFNIDSKYKTSNGNARTFPENIINLYNYPPNNKEHLIIMEDWWQGLILHEFTHIIHLDQTRDYTEVGKSIFGTVAKLPAAIAPRWFTEGIAVFSESKFLKAGRVQNKILKQQLKNFWSNPKNCHDLSCLDNPGTFPSGQLAYWAGGEFLTYLENKKVGTINCLIKDNAGRIPFFLDDVFVNCTSENAETNFANFIKTFTSNTSSDSQPKIENIYGAIDYQKGILLEGDKLVRIERTKKMQYLVASDLDGNVALTNTFSNPISDISNSIQLEDDNLGIVVAFDDDPTFKTNGKIWKLIDLDTLTEERTLAFNTDPSYVIGLSKDVYATFYYKNNKWSYQKVRLENEKSSILAEYNFSTDFNLNFVRKLGDKIYIKLTNVNDQNAILVAADFDFINMTNVFESKSYFEILGRVNKSLVVKESDKVFSIKEESGKFIQTLFDYPLFANVVLIEENDFFKMTYQNDLTLSAPDNQKYGKTNLLPIKEFKMEASDNQLHLSTRSYPRLEHYIPKYWFLSFSSSENLASLGALTSFADPNELHSLKASAFVFPEYSKVGGNLNYQYSDDPKGIILNASNDYDLSNVNSSLTKSSSLNLMGYYKIENKKHTYTPYVLLGKDSTNDFISDRSTTYYGVQSVYQYAANTYVDLLRNFVVSNFFSIDTPSNGNAYLRMQNLIEANFTLDEDLFLQAKLSEGKLFKSDYRRGVIYAGGVNSLNKNRVYENYSIAYGNAYGNDIWSSRLKLDYNMFDFYKGVRLIPFYLEELHGIFGYENLSSEVIYADKKYYFDKILHSVFIGLKAKTVLFYYVPTDVELVLAKGKIGSEKDLNSASVLLTIGL